MRMWEFDDNRAAPANLVLEQDFILRIRRMQRLGTPFLVANICLSQIPPERGGRGLLEDAQRRLQSIVMAQKGSYAEMTNGDVFLIWPQSSLSKEFPHQALVVALPHGVSEGDYENYVSLYYMPDDYTLLRERANRYVHDAKEISASNEDEDSPAKLLQHESTRGHLSAWTVSLIERLIKEIDLCPYIRSQTIYEYQKDNSWRQCYDETFIGLDDVKQRYFPHIDITQPKHLFLGLCEALDRNLLGTLTLNYESVSDMKLSLNLSLPTVLGIEFAQFTHRISRGNRGNIIFEIHCGDLMQEFSQTLNAIATLRQEGYRVLIDGITPDMLGYFNLPRFDVDFIKIDVSKDHASSLKSQVIREQITKTPREKLIFFHCDNEQSLRAGLDLGVVKFQGWLIDEKARAWRK